MPTLSTIITGQASSATTKAPEKNARAIKKGQYFLCQRPKHHRWVMHRAAEDSWFSGSFSSISMRVDKRYQPEYGWMRVNDHSSASIQNIIAVYNTDEEANDALEILQAAYDAMKAKTKEGEDHLKVTLALMSDHQ